MSSFLCLSGSACFCTVLIPDNTGDTHTPTHANAPNVLMAPKEYKYLEFPNCRLELVKHLG